MQLTFVSRSYLDTERGCQVVVNVPATTGSKRSLPSVHHGNNLSVTAFSSGGRKRQVASLCQTGPSAVAFIATCF